MKKIWLALAGLVLAFSASAAQYEDGKQYTTLEKPVAGAPPGKTTLPGDSAGGLVRMPMP